MRSAMNGIRNESDSIGQIELHRVVVFRECSH